MTEVHSKRPEATITMSSKKKILTKKTPTRNKIVQMESGSALKQVPRDMVGSSSLGDEAWLGKALSILICIVLKVGPGDAFQPELSIPWDTPSSVQPLRGGMRRVGHLLPPCVLAELVQAVPRATPPPQAPAEADPHTEAAVQVFQARLDGGLSSLV